MASGIGLRFIPGLYWKVREIENRQEVIRVPAGTEAWPWRAPRRLNLAAPGGDVPLRPPKSGGREKIS